MRITKASRLDKKQALKELGAPDQVQAFGFTSYDAIIPFINNKKLSLAPVIEGYLNGKHPVLQQSPSQLVDLLLVVTGKFEP